LKEVIKDVSLADLNRVFKQYMNNITWVYQGDPEKVNSALFIQKQTPTVPKEAKSF
jgi:hypothetical protein